MFLEDSVFALEQIARRHAAKNAIAAVEVNLGGSSIARKLRRDELNTFSAIRKCSMIRNAFWLLKVRFVQRLAREFQGKSVKLTHGQTKTFRDSFLLDRPTSHFRTALFCAQLAQTFNC